MTTAKTEEKTSIGIEERYKVSYEKKSFLGCITWYTKEHTDRIGRDLVINTLEEYDKIILNVRK